MNQTQLIQIGMLVVFIGVIIIFSSIFFAQPEGRSKVKFSVFGLIGPIPFGFSNDKRLFLFSLIVFVIIVVLTLILFYSRVRLWG
jgi:uncharacterized membrane protein